MKIKMKKKKTKKKKKKKKNIFNVSKNTKHEIPPPHRPTHSHPFGSLTFVIILISFFNVAFSCFLEFYR